jgi:uncharacterized protein (DUF1697 family)
MARADVRGPEALRYIALLRAVNIGSHNKVSMAALRDLLGKLGFSEPQTLLQSGNTVFGSSKVNSAELERQLESAVARQLQVTTQFFVRSALEWEEIVRSNPFTAEAQGDPGHLIVMVLKEPATDRAIDKLREAITGREVVAGGSRHVYIVYPEGIGRSRLTHPLIEKKLGTSGTGRNWNTVLKLQALASAR